MVWVASENEGVGRLLVIGCVVCVAAEVRGGCGGDILAAGIETGACLEQVCVRF